jgi:hypothetical protein
MAISAGDAIFNFLGDATQLDQTWAKVETDANAKAPDRPAAGQPSGMHGREPGKLRRQQPSRRRRPASR